MAPIKAMKQTKTQFHFSRRISLSVSVRSVHILRAEYIIILLSNTHCWSNDLQLIR